MRLDEIVGYVQNIATYRRDYWAMQSLLGGFEMTLCGELAYLLNGEELKAWQSIDNRRIWRSEYKRMKSPRIDIARIVNEDGRKNSFRIDEAIEIKVAHLCYGSKLSERINNVGRYLIKHMEEDIEKYKWQEGERTNLFCVGVLLETVRESSVSIDHRMLNSGVRYGWLNNEMESWNAEKYPEITKNIKKVITKKEERRWYVYSPACLGNMFGWQVRWHIIGVHNEVRL